MVERFVIGMKFMQKLGKSIMLPVACMPLCGILMGIGYLLCPAAMQGGSSSGVVSAIGMFLVQAGSALINHIALLFAVGVGVGMAKDRDGTAGLAALVSWLMIITLLNADFLAKVLPSVVSNEVTAQAFTKIENPFIGILSGLIGALCYNRFRNTRLPEWLAFFSGKRSSVIVAGFASLLVSGVLLLVWPVLYGALVAIGNWIAGLGPAGAGLYAFFNRLLLPFGLHHALNNVFWFDSIGLGDLTHFWAGETSADVTWSLGIYMSGFFPCMMFGVPGAALAMLRCAKPEKRKSAAGVLVSAAVCSFVCGVTEPFEFAFMFVSPQLYILYALLYGLFSWAVALSGFRAGFAFSAGGTDLLFSASLPAANQTWLILPFGLAAFIIFYLVFRGSITWFDLKTPGREVEEAGARAEKLLQGSAFGSQSAAILDGLGGKDNIISVDHCITRLRLEVRDVGTVDQQKLLDAGAKGVMKLSANSVQVVIGLQVEQVAEELKALLAESADASPAPVPVISCSAGCILPPVKGKVIPRAEIPDPTFAEGIMGEGVGILPEEETVSAPVDGTVITVTPTGHAVGLSGNGMEILIHVGIDTVQMNGEGFSCLVKEGDTVRIGQPLIRFDSAKIKAAGYSDMVVVMLTNAEDLR